MSSRRTGLLATPTQIQSALYQFLDSLKRLVENIDTRVQEIDDRDDTAVRFIVGNVPDGHTITTGVHTVTFRDGNLQRLVNNGAFTLVPPTESGVVNLMIYNGPSAGAITTSAFTQVIGTTPGTTNDYKFLARITVVQGLSLLEWSHMQ